MKKEYEGLQNKEKTYEGWIKYDRFGYEGLAEVLSYRFSRLLDTRLSFCEYIPIRDGKRTGCFSKSVVTDDEQLISLYSFFTKEPESLSERDLFEYYVPRIIQITGLKDFGEWLTEMFIFDMLILNEDRNPGNILLIKTADKYGYAPVMDNANSLGYKDESNTSIGDKIAKPLMVSHRKQADLFRSRYHTDLKLMRNDLRISDLYDYYTKSQISYACDILARSVEAYFSSKIEFL